MPGLLQYPLFQAFDSNGDPLTGGLLYTYLAGTTTDKSTYSDRELTSANANPVVLDSRGEATIHFRGRTKLVLKDSAGTTIWTRDNVEGVMQSKNVRYADESETDHGAAGNGNSLKDLIDDIGASLEATIVFRHDSGAGNTTTYTVATNETIPSNIKLVVEKGARLDIDAGVTLTVEGEIEAGAYQIFSGSGTATYSAVPGVHYNEWESGGSGTKIIDTLELASGTTINEISTDTTLAGNSDDAVPTEKAVKAYADDNKVPTGAVMGFYFETPPTNWLECDGSAISRSTYADLFAVIGTVGGVGDGSLTFNLPDLRGEFVRGWDNGRGKDVDAASRTDSGDGSTTGDSVGTKQADAYLAHTHTTHLGAPTATNRSGYNVGAQGTYFQTGVSGSSGGNETRPDNVGLMMCIKY